VAGGDGVYDTGSLPHRRRSASDEHVQVVVVQQNHPG
jgi:hypothetical protein